MKTRDMRHLIIKPGGRRPVIIVGESWNASSITSQFATVADPRDHSDACRASGRIGWCLPYALRAGAFKYGPCRRRLDSLGLTWDAAVNLLPPMPSRKWPAAAAVAMAGAVLDVAAELNAVLVLAGFRVTSAFAVHADGALEGMEWFERRTFRHCGGVVAVHKWPHPSGLCREWNDDATMVCAVASAKSIAVESER